METMISDLQREILDTYNTGPGPQGFLENCQAFSNAINWKESWIRTLIIFHFSVLILVFLTRKLFALQVGIFFSICVLVRLSEWINGKLARIWDNFSTQNYFDERGVFMGVMWSAPLLAILFMMMINFLLSAANLLVVVKKAELKAKMKREKANKGN
mmetsp:Transcript_7859/g.11873  ORF Transcript_7859/g.11873 Transcript_7859/m.11873 type:complete len:157 (-) Transcript_7859:1016-1486(-)